MNGRGGVDIILIGIALEMGLIEQNTFSILVFMALLTTAVVPVALKTGVGWLKERGELVRSGSEKSGIIIVGAGPLARWLARALSESSDVTLVDSNENNCLVSKSEGLSVVHGSALQQQVLSEADAANAALLIAMTPNVEVNTIVAQTSRDVFEVPDVYLFQTGSESDMQTRIR